MNGERRQCWLVPRKEPTPSYGEFAEHCHPGHINFIRSSIKRASPMTQPTHPPIDLTKLQPGDEVTVRLHVVRVNVHTDSVWFHLTNDTCSHDVLTAADILTHTPRALAVGDRVKHHDYGEHTLLATHDGYAWIDGPLGLQTVHLASLSRA